MGQLGAGFARGINDVGNTMDNIAAWGDRNLPGAQALDTAANQAGNAVSGMMGLPPGSFGRTPEMNQQILAQDAAGRAAYQQQSGDSLAAGIGRVGGNLALSVPAMVTGAGLLGAGADALGAGLGTDSAAGQIVSGANKLLSGTAAAPSAGAVPNLLLRGASLAASGAAQGAGYGAISSGGNGQSVGQGAESGAELGGALGPLAGAAGNIGSKVSGLITGGASVDAGRATLAEMAMNKYGIPLNAPQVSGNAASKWLANAGDTMSGASTVANTQATQLQAYTRAISKTFGADSPELTPEVMQAAKDNLGQTFDNIASKTIIQADQPFTQGLLTIQDEAAKVLPASEVVPIQNQITNVLSAAGDDGTISGSAYQALTRKGAPLDRAIQSDDPNVSYYAQQIRSTLDDAMQRSLQSSGQTDLLNQLQQTRLQYRNLMTVAPLAAKSVDGTISPSLLKGAVVRSFGNSAFTGAGDLGNLANIGQTFIKPQPSSGTAERLLALDRISNGVEGVGAILSGHPLVGAAALAKIPAQMVAGRIIGKVMNSPYLANKLVQRSLAPAAAGGNKLIPAIGYGTVTPLLAPPVNKLLNQN